MREKRRESYVVLAGTHSNGVKGRVTKYIEKGKKVKRKRRTRSRKNGNLTRMTVVDILVTK